jgi:uncharacterized protein YndB with AHSA1/START domain
MSDAKGDIMKKESANDQTVRLHRVLRAPADRVYRAFIEPQAKCKWLPPHGYSGEFQQHEGRVGGKYHMTFTNFRTGEVHAFGGTYTELTPHTRIRYSDSFDNPNLPGEMQITVSLREIICGTELSILQENIPAPIPADFCYLGWQESLQQLAALVEPEAD